MTEEEILKEAKKKINEIVEDCKKLYKIKYYVEQFCAYHPKREKKNMGEG